MSIGKLVGVIIVTFLFFSIPLFSQKEPCSVFPADCPNQQDISDAQNKEVCMKNAVTKREFAVQDSFHSIVTDLMNELAKQENISMEEFDAEYCSCCAMDKGTPDPKKPSHYYGVAFQFIVNEDSLKLWKKWLMDYNGRVISNTQKSISDIQNSNTTTDQNQTLADSITYYSNEETKYITTHSQEYQNAIANNDQAYIAKWQKQMDYYNSKTSTVSNKVNHEANTQQQGTTLTNTLQDEHDRMTQLFRNACVVQVYIQYNKALSEGMKNLIQNLSLPGATMVNLYSIPHPDLNTLDFAFMKFLNVENILLGEWQPKPDRYYLYHSAYSADSRNTDDTSVKKMTSSKIQVISIHVCGRKDKIEKIARDINLEKLNSFITK